MSESVVSIQDHQKAIGQLMRLKAKLQTAESERDAAISAKQARDKEYELIAQEFQSVKAVADRPAKIQDELMQELEGFRRQTKLTALQTAIDSTGKIRKGVKLEQVAKLKGLDLDQLTVEQIQDAAFVGELVAWAETDAPFILGSSEPAPAAPEPESVMERPSLAPNVARRLPTFTSASGGGTPPPGEIPNSTARLRDPADARRRMLEARAEARPAY